MKIVINSCYGGFSLSPMAALRLWKEGCPEIGYPVEEYYNFTKRGNLGYQKDLKKWQEFLVSPKRPFSFITVFSDDGKFVIDTRPSNHRTDKRLIKIVEEMGEEANGSCAELEIVDIPDGISYEIDEYDGIESIHEIHRSWP